MANDPLEAALRRFSPAARQVVHKAKRLAQDLSHGFVGIEHLLAVLIEDSPASRRLRSDTVRAFQAVLEPLLRAEYDLDGDPTRPFVTHRVQALFTDRVFTVAQQRRHDRVEPDDLLTAILRDGQSLPVRQLQEQGVDTTALLDHLEPAPVAQQELVLPRELRRWCTDLTARAEQGQLTMVVEGKREQQVLDQVSRSLLSADLGMGPAAPVLVGEAGVGKTALVDLLAQKIIDGEVSQGLQGTRLIQVDMGGMLEGTQYRGSFEQRLRQTLEFAQTHRDEVILFVDELHLIVGAGQAAGTAMGADQMLLDPLGRGDIRLIGATTSAQYREHIEQDDALERRFRSVPVEEPSWDATKEILSGAVPGFEERSGLQIAPEVVDKLLELSRLYMSSRKLPGKPLQWLREACELSLHRAEAEILPKDVVRVVSEQTGVPKDVIFRDARGRLPHMERILRKRVKGQDHVVSQVSQRIRLNLSPLREDDQKPIGVFLFLGPSGVGKTETAKALAEFLFDSEDRLIRLDMSEYTNELAVRELIGQPRGIVGAAQGGRLANAVRAQPYSIVLLDEFEKAHPAVRNLFLQVFDEGRLTDGMGRTVPFNDTILIATSNLASEKYRRLMNRPGFEAARAEESDFSGVRDEIENALIEEGLLLPELQNRFDRISVFDPLSRDVLEEIAEQFLSELAADLATWGKELHYDDDVAEYLANEGFDPLMGARAMHRLFTEDIREELAAQLEDGQAFRLRLAKENSRPTIDLDVEREVPSQELTEG